MIINCTCPHPYQDEKYGKGRRVANPLTGGQSQLLIVNCTACGQDKHTSRKAPRQVKAGGGSGKNRYWMESPEKTRKRFDKTTGGLYR